MDGIALTKLDVLDTFDQIKICTGYKLNGKKINYFPSSESEAENILEPMYEVHERMDGKYAKEQNHGQNYLRWQ